MASSVLRMSTVPLSRQRWKAVLVQCRAVTDIVHYREVDQSHLHMWEAQSTMRKFLLKLREREAAERMAASQRASLSTAAAEPVVADQATEDAEPIVLSKYVERSPSDILKLISSHVGKDYTAPDYRFHDDPYLTPYNSVTKRDYIMSKDGGRRSARYIINEHAELFEKNQIEMVPEVKALLPAVTLKEEKASVETLRAFLEGYNVSAAVEVYKTLLKEGTEVHSDLKQRLLELVAFTNEEPATDENYTFTIGVERRQEEKSWKSGGLAEEIYSKSADSISAEARLALLCGMAKHREYARAWQMYEECKANNVRLDVFGYNAALSASVGDCEKATACIDRIVDLLKEMASNGVRPNADTLVCGLTALATYRSTPQRQAAAEAGLKLLTEFRNAGFDVSLGAYRKLLLIKRDLGASLQVILREVENREWTPMLSCADQEFFPAAMRMAVSETNLEAAYDIHTLLLHGQNEALICGHNAKFSYYLSFMELVLQKEPLDVFMDWYNKLVPHTWCPTLRFSEEMLRKLVSSGGQRYLPKFWTDLMVSAFSQANKFDRLDFMTKFVGEAHTCMTQGEEIDKVLAENLLQIGRDCLADVMRDPDHRRWDLAQNRWAALICDVVVPIGLHCHNDDGADGTLREKGLRLARDAMDFCISEVDRMPGSLSAESVSALTIALIKASEKEAALECLNYAVGLSMKGSIKMAEHLSRSMELDEKEKNQLNLLFADDVKWQKLV